MWRRGRLRDVWGRVMETRPLPVQRVTHGYTFTTAVTPRYVVLSIRPHPVETHGTQVYYLTPEEARALMAVLDILPDPPE